MNRRQRKIRANRLVALGYVVFLVSIVVSGFTGLVGFLWGIPIALVMFIVAGHIEGYPNVIQR